MDYRLLIKGCALGLGAAAPIGPVNVEIARRTLRAGFRAGFALGCGAVTVDVGYAVLASLSLRPVLSHPWVLNVIGIAGAALLIYLGVSCLRQAFKAQAIIAADSPARGAGRHYLTGLLMTALNPMTLVFWFVIVPGLVAKATPDPSRDLPLVCAGVFIAALAWVLGFTGSIAWAGSLGKQRWARVADVVGGSLLLAFAGVAIWRTARGFLS